MGIRSVIYQALSFFFFLNFFISSIGYGQDSTATFRVLLDNGKSFYRIDETWQNLIPGTSLKNTDLVKVEEGAYLGLIHAGGHTLSLTKPGIYKVRDLTSQFINPTSGMAMHYADMLIDEMQTNKIKTNSTLALERGNPINDKSEKLNLFLPNTANIYNKQVLIMWNNIEGAESYEIILKNMFDEAIESKTVKGTKFTLDFSDPNLSNEKLVIISVRTKGVKEIQSNNYGIKPLGQTESEDITAQLSRLKQEISQKESALDKIILASFYEQNNLLVDAITNYESAIALAPGIDVIKNAYDQFLTRNGLRNQISTFAN